MGRTTSFLGSFWVKPVPAVPAPPGRLQGTQHRGDNALSLTGTIQDPSPLTPQPCVGPGALKPRAGGQVSPLKGTGGSPSPQNAAGDGTDSKISLGMGEGLDAEQGGGRGGARGVTAVSPPRTAIEDTAALPGTPHPRGRRLEPAPSPSELLIGVFFLRRSSSGINPRGECGTPAARAGSSSWAEEERNTARGPALSFVHHQQ